MPHLIIEHSNNLTIKTEELVATIHQAAISTALFDLTTVKTRANSFEYFQLGNGKAGFVHVQAHIMAGREVDQKQRLSETLLYALEDAVGDDFQLSVHVYDLLPEIYRKN
jgi:5-carboxymethyl-2-hydroxymuconate isomerase